MRHCVDFLLVMVVLDYKNQWRRGQGEGSAPPPKFWAVGQWLDNFWRNHMITCSQIFDFTYVNELPKMSIKAENEEIFTMISCFSNYFATNHTCARNAISMSQLFFQASVNRERL